MRMFKDYVVPASLDEARAALKRLGDEGMPLAGASSLLFLRHKEPKVAVDLSRAGLGGIRPEGGAFSIGAMVTIDDLRRYAAAGWVLDRVALHFVTQQVRNMSTLGGNIVRVFAWADFPVALLALDATMTVRGDTPRSIGADEFFNGQPARLLKSGDLLVGVQVPALKPGEGFGFRKQRRTSADFSQATAAVWLRVEGGTVAEARVALGAAVTFPARLKGVEAALVGKKGGERVFRDAAAQVGERNWRSVAGFSPEYIQHVAHVTLADALSQAWTEAAG